MMGDLLYLSRIQQKNIFPQMGKMPFASYVSQDVICRANT